MPHTVISSSGISGIPKEGVCCSCCSVAKSCPTLCNPIDCMQHGRLPCPSLCPGVCSNSCLLSQWCYFSTSSSATLFSFCLHFSPASVFSSDLSLSVRGPKYWSFISPFKESVKEQEIDMVTIIIKITDFFRTDINLIITLTSVLKRLEIHVLGERNMWNSKTRSLMETSGTLFSLSSQANKEWAVSDVAEDRSQE